MSGIGLNSPNLGFRVIINDDFLEDGLCHERTFLPSIIYFGRLFLRHESRKEGIKHGG